MESRKRPCPLPQIYKRRPRKELSYRDYLIETMAKRYGRPPGELTRIACLLPELRARICLFYIEAENDAMVAAEPEKPDWPNTNTPANHRKNKAYATRWNRWRQKQIAMERRIIQVTAAIFGETK